MYGNKVTKGQAAHTSQIYVVFTNELNKLLLVCTVMLNLLLVYTCCVENMTAEYLFTRYKGVENLDVF